MNDILAAIGEALIDFIPDRSGCGFDEVEAFAPKVGGAPANVCAAFSRLGGKSRLLTQLGDDPFGHRIIHRLESVGVDTSCISLTDRANTALAFVSLAENGDRTFSFYRKPSADMLYSAESIRENYFDGVFCLHFCSVSIGDFPMKDAHRRAIDILKRRGGIVSFDPNLRFNLWESLEALKTAVREFIPFSDIVKLSEEELEFITGCTAPEEGAKWLFDQGVKLMLYTLGSKGAYAFTENTKAFSPAYKVCAVDTTGAGDGFTGAFLYRLHELGAEAGSLGALSAKTLTECLDFSNRFCALSVTKKGAIASYPDAEELRSLELK
ncbi:MAG: carbohydrate kinase [Ruminococcus sp.]|nr:carbohydrate kinase [Ruminococcus sp.]MBR6968796.1 carbohydrate kinase [Ruminococcus sp.]